MFLFLFFLQYIFANLNKPVMNSTEPVITSIYDISVTDMNMEEYKLERYRGKVLLIVNVASKCGLADKSYTELSKLLKEYSNKGLLILLFPCSQFRDQEYKEKQEIKDFVAKYGKEFILMDSVQVKGPNIHPLFKFLIENLEGFGTDDIKWNFTYFLIGRQGELVKRYSPISGISPDDKDLVKCIEGTVVVPRKSSNSASKSFLNWFR